MSTATALLWSEQGHISCAKHAPYKHSDTWRSERWGPIPEADRETAAAEGWELRCETCAHLERRRAEREEASA